MSQHRLDMQGSDSQALDRQILDVIVPAYLGLPDLKRCLESVRDSVNETPYSLIIVDDASPEPGVSEWLSAFATDTGATLLTNEANQGFVKSVMRAAALHPDRDFILLNGDTQVAGNWIDRLVACAERAGRVATVTPFSNNATLASYPRIGADNALPADVDFASLDTLFAQQNANQSVNIPTGVGFCLWVSRAAWDDVGGFDLSFGRGYGEEVDFCMALGAKGWRHLLAADVFVFHKGNVSFGEGAASLKESAQVVIDERYPEFPQRVADFFTHDPVKFYRQRVDVARFARISSRRILFVSHSWGGGVARHVRELAQLLESSGSAAVLLLEPRGHDRVELSWVNPVSDLSLTLSADNPDELFAKLQQLDIDLIHYHHLMGFSPWVLDLPSALSVPYWFTVHDFMVACPQLHFLTADGGYCGQPDVEGCRACVARRPDPWGWGIDDWRQKFAVWLDHADHVIAPNESVAKSLQTYFPAVTVDVLAHPEEGLDAFTRLPERSLGRRKIAILGTLSPAKGLERVRELVTHIRENQLPLDLVVVGASTEPTGIPEGPDFVLLGEYRERDLSALLQRERIDAFFLASVIPESYSYALSTAMASGLTVVAFNLGAIGERLAGYPAGLLLSPDSSVTRLAQALLDVPPAFTVTNSDVALVDAARANAVSPSDYVSKLADWLPVLRTRGDEVQEVWSSSVASGQQPVARDETAIPEQDMRSLISAALECKQRESRDQLIRKALENERDVQTLSGALKAERDEVAHLKALVPEIQARHQDDVASLREVVENERAESQHLRQTIQSLKAAQQQHVSALEETIGELKQLADTREHEIAALAAERGRLNDERKALAQRIAELENSTFWRMTYLPRQLAHQMKRLIRAVIARVAFLRRLLVFIRYHYAIGGMRGLLASVRRRTAALFTPSPVPAYTKSSSISASDRAEAVSGPLVLRTSEEPVISIVIPSYGEHDVTYQCLRSIAEHPPSHPFEVLVADDAFEQRFSAEALEITGVRVLRQPENLGFLRNVNAAVAVAAGEAILLLNNDTLVHEGAIDQLYRTLQTVPGAGAAGAKLIGSDGLLQEAGGIVWRDASAWNWGKGADPEDPRFNYLREADYCSAAALLVSRSVWDAIGGFDEQFVPAYYEDTDLCFALKNAGYKVIYQAAAVVTHLEGVSHGTSTDQGIKRHQVINQAVFQKKWAERLASHEENGRHPELERDRDAVWRVLWVEACMLTPDQDSGSLRTWRIMEILLELGAKVTFVADNLQRLEPYSGQLQQLGVEVLYAPQIRSVGDYIEQHGAQYDVITLCRHYIAINYCDLIRRKCPRAQIWFDTIDLHYLRLRRQHALDGLDATKAMGALAYKEEMAVISASDVTLVVSDVEVDELSKEAPSARVAVLSNIHVSQQTVAPRSSRQNIMFVGGFQHPPNIDAVEYYAREIWPQVRATHPDIKTYIIGSKMPDSLRKLGEEAGLDMLGFVEDLEPYYEQCILAIAPLRYGAGVKGKVNQALSFGLPVVGTSMAFEGMAVEHRHEVMIAKDAAAFVTSINEVIADDALWETLSQRGQASLEREFSVDVARTQLAALLAEVAR